MGLLLVSGLCILCFLFVSVYYIYFFFFFSSRRRHTRSDRDWSSDVCSSDLPACEHYEISEALVFQNRVGRSRPLPACGARGGARVEGSEELQARTSVRVGAAVGEGRRRVLARGRRRAVEH